MKKAKDARPNQALFQAREQMGWSRARLADQVGTNAFTIYRWERGLAFPGYFFRHKLCEVFHSTPEALGLIHAEATQRAGTSPLIPPPDALPPVEGLPRPPTVIGREVCLSQLQRDLGMAAAVALSGLPGVGKTTLVARLAQDAESQARYPDGVLWARLGPQADAQAQLGQWAIQLGMSERHLASVRDGATLSRMVHLLLHTKQMVLVIDDAWQIEEALLFKVGGPRCSHLLTTRFPSLAQQFAPGHTFAIPELDAQASWTLLEVSAPTAVVHAPDLIRELLPSVGGLPLALLLLGRALERYAQTGQTRRVRTFLRDMHETASRLSLTAPVAPTDVIPSGVTHSTISLEAVIGQSVQRLEPAARALLADLALFPAKPNSFAETLAHRVSALPIEAFVESLDALVDAGLVECSEPEHYTLHQTIADYARVRLAKAEARPRFAQALLRWCVEECHPDQTLQQEQANLWVALDLARDSALEEDFVRGFVALCDWARRYGKREAFIQYGPSALEIAKRLEDRRLLGRVLRHLSHFAEHQGQYDQSTTYATEAMAHAQASDDAHTSQALQYLLGTLALRRADLPLAQHYLQLGVASARQLGDERAAGATLVQLGATYSMSQPEQAKGYYEEALAMAHRLGDRALVASCLLNLGVLAGNRGTYTEAECRFREVLTLARELASPLLLSDVLNNLGQLALERGQYEKAHACLTEALDLSIQLGHRQRQCALLGVLGEVAAHQQRGEQALAYLEEGVSIARTIGHRLGLGNLLATQGSVWLDLGQTEAAAQALEESIQIAQESEQHVLLGRCWELTGRLNLHTHLVDAAQAAFEKALQLAQTDGMQTLEALAEYGLARVAAARGQIPQAVQHGQHSLECFRILQHALLPEVEAWLETLRRARTIQNGYQAR